MIKLLAEEVPLYKQLIIDNKHDPEQVREIIHGMIGDFHFSGAKSIQKLLLSAQKTYRNPKSSPVEISNACEQLIAELQLLENFLATNTIKFTDE